MMEGERGIDAPVGFLGAGGIAAALAAGFCGAGAFRGKIHIYNPSVGKARAMKELCPDRISIAGSNQEVIDETEVVFPALLPDVLRRVAPSLKFRGENRVVHIAAGVNLAEARPWFEPARSVVRAVPLPFASERRGPVVLFGDDPEVRGLLSLVGTVVAVPSERELEVLAAITGMMVPYCALAGETVGWGVGKGAGFQSVLRYTMSMNEALSALMRDRCGEDIEAFLAKNATPGGMNELGLKTVRDAGACGAWRDALERIGRRYGL